MFNPNLRITAVVILTATGAACGGGSTPASSNPTAPSQPIGQCRTYAAVTSISGLIRGERTCGFDSGVNRLTCVRVPGNEAPRVTEISEYASTADFVDEVRVVPPRNLKLSFTSKVSSNPETITEYIYEYDQERRMVASDSWITYGNGPRTVAPFTRFTSWDAAGRHTSYMSAIPGYPDPTISYNDVARTTTFNLYGGDVTVDAFDENGILLRETRTNAAGIRTDEYFTTQTARVCK